MDHACTPSLQHTRASQPCQKADHRLLSIQGPSAQTSLGPKVPVQKLVAPD